MSTIMILCVIVLVYVLWMFIGAFVIYFNCPDFYTTNPIAGLVALGLWPIVYLRNRET